ncbi:hypothetical protein CEXT_318611 [Caerostris extrusa]|uniref:Secreted protein n=1 Tax=Caerostris extrusa TaxID=172846 RepID=A0AAV4TTB6_CAEEX|nr:hypothetical protein CEXT_318611 [Caerostris extrusa]
MIGLAPLRFSGLIAFRLFISLICNGRDGDSGRITNGRINFSGIESNFPFEERPFFNAPEVINRKRVADILRPPLPSPCTMPSDFHQAARSYTSL